MIETGHYRRKGSEIIDDGYSIMEVRLSIALEFRAPGFSRGYRHLWCRCKPYLQL
jgi:hypothetical protein